MVSICMSLQESILCSSVGIKVQSFSHDVPKHNGTRNAQSVVQGIEISTTAVVVVVSNHI